MRLETPAAGICCRRNLHANAAIDLCGYGHGSWHGHASVKAVAITTGKPRCVSWCRDVNQRQHLSWHRDVNAWCRS